MLPDTNTPRTPRRPAGFTLVELLVGAALLAILVLFLGAIFGNVSKTWQIGETNAERLQNIRAISDFMSGELRSALLPVNRTDKLNLQFVLNPTSISADYKNPDAFFWQSPNSPDQTYGDVAAVGYFVKWDTSSGGAPRPILCRFSAIANDTNGPNPNFLVYSQNASTTWLSDAILDNVAPGTKDRSYQGLIADNVVALFVQALDAQGQPITQSYTGANLAGRFDSRLGFTDATGTKSADFTDASGNKSPLCVLPPIARVSLVIIDSRTARKLTPAHQATLTTLAAQIAAQNPKGDAAAFVAAALNDSSLGAINSGLRAYQTEVTLQNAR